VNGPVRPSTIDTEVAIVGGGLGGLPLGIALARAGIATAVIDREPPASMLEAPFDGRTTAIACGSRRVLDAIGVWRHLADRVQPILDIRVADAGSSLFLHYDHRAIGDEPFGWIVENRDLRRAMFAAAVDLPALSHLAPAAVERVERMSERIALTLSGGGTVRARLAVGADGKRSMLRDWAGIGTIGTTYAQHSIICTVEHERPHHGVAIEHFLPSGPFAILPMTGNRSSVVWTERADLVPGFLALDDAGFAAEVASRFGSWLGVVRVAGPRGAYPLEVLLARRMAAPRLALVAESAHVIHPIAGQGLNLGIRDVAVLAELVVDQCRLGLDPGARSLLERYERRRRGDTLLLTAATDGINRLFSNDIAPVRRARGIGLAAVERLPPLKRLFMRHAMGLLGDLPRLVAGEPL
jgi:2-octaprenyl-6-methoxyphenol hydroxylase